MEIIRDYNEPGTVKLKALCTGLQYNWLSWPRMFGEHKSVLKVSIT